MTELEQVEELHAFYTLRGKSFCGEQAAGHVLELCDIARKALEERDELKKDFTVSEDLRMVRERQLKRVMNQRDRLQRRLDVATKIVHELKEDLAGELADRYSHCLDYPSMKRKYDQDMEPVERARAWMEDVASWSENS